MATATLRKVGGSIMLALPPATLDELKLSAGSTVILETEGGKLTIAPARPRYTLDELLGQCDPDAARSDEERSWLEDEPVGNEAI